MGDQDYYPIQPRSSGVSSRAVPDTMIARWGYGVMSLSSDECR